MLQVHVKPYKLFEFDLAAKYFVDHHKLLEMFHWHRNAMHITVTYEAVLDDLFDLCALAHHVAMQANACTTLFSICILNEIVRRSDIPVDCSYPLVPCEVAHFFARFSLVVQFHVYTHDVYNPPSFYSRWFHEHLRLLIANLDVSITYHARNVLDTLDYTTVNARFSAAAFIKFYNLLVRRLIESGAY